MTLARAVRASRRGAASWAVTPVSRAASRALQLSQSHRASTGSSTSGGICATSGPGSTNSSTVGASAADYPGLDLPEDVYAANVYPAREVPEFEAAVSEWFLAAGAVARTMVRIFGVALGGREDFFAGVTGHSIDVLRVNNYRLPHPGTPLEPDQLGMGAHTDYGIVTVLWADRVPGLEILGADGGWHPVMPAGDALLVNLGDAIARWTNEEWISTMHRVAAPRVNGVLVPRRSAAYFHDGDVDALIECLPSCVSAANPARYAPVTVGEHLAAKLAGSRGGQLNPYATREIARLRSA